MANRDPEKGKQLVQQKFHPCMFEQKQPSMSTNVTPNLAATDIEPSTSTIDPVHDNNTHSQDSQPSHEKNMSNKQNIGTNQPPPWQRIPENHNKKRKIGSLYQDKTPEKIPTSNRFNGLKIDSAPENPEPVQHKPPPILLYGIEDVNKLTTSLLTVVDKAHFTIKIVNKNQLRLSCVDIITYKKIIDHIRSLNLIGYTFTPRENKCTRIVIRKLHHTTPHDEIKQEIEKSGNLVRGEIINARYGPDKTPTSTFFVNVEPGPNNKCLKDIKYIYFQSVVIEDPKKKKSVVQCHRCQQYGHSKNNCMRPYKCLKCGEGHNTVDCPKKRDVPPTCALCSEEHPANYKGCSIYKEILAKKGIARAKLAKPAPEMKNMYINHAVPTALSHDMNQVTHNKRSTMSYASVTKSNQNENEHIMVQQHRPHEPIQTKPTEEKDSFNCFSQVLDKFLQQQALKMDMLMNQISNLLSVITSLMPRLVPK